MSYDAKTKTITVNQDSDFIVDSGYYFVDTLRKLAFTSNAPPQIKSDWQVIAAWLDNEGQEGLSDHDGELIGTAWKAYLGAGIAPSRELQPLFDSVHEQYKRDGVEYDSAKPPVEVKRVFDRLLATEAEIRANSKNDRNAEKDRSEPPLKSLQSEGKKSWWRRQSRNFRRWAFVSVAWPIAVFFFVAIFDPFNNGSWRYMDDEEYIQMFTVMAVPFLTGIVSHLYTKWVK